MTRKADVAADVDVLIPSYRRPGALAATLACLAAQGVPAMHVVVSDQSPDHSVLDAGEVLAVTRFLAHLGHDVDVVAHLPRRGMAEQRQFLLDQARTPAALFLDDDVLLAPGTVARMLAALRQADIGFVGCGLVGLSYADDRRPHEQRLEIWDGRVVPEQVTPESPAWSRHVLHNAANLLHVAQRLDGRLRGGDVLYKVAWVGGCVLYDVARLRACGGFEFWRSLPAEHVGEDVLAQLRVMARYGGAGLLPTGAYHQELPTTLPDRDVDAPRVAGL